jgi:hypothetical protein
MLDEWGGEGAHSGLPTAARLVSCIWKEAVPGIASLEGPGNLQLRTGLMRERNELNTRMMLVQGGMG